MRHLVSSAKATNMKSLVLCVTVMSLCALAMTLSIRTDPPSCPPSTPEQGAILLPNKDDCCTFYSCNGPNPILLPCLNETWFNPELSVCDWPFNVPQGACVPPPAGKCLNETSSSEEMN